MPRPAYAWAFSMPLLERTQSLLACLASCATTGFVSLTPSVTSAPARAMARSEAAACAEALEKALTDFVPSLSWTALARWAGTRSQRDLRVLA